MTISLENIFNWILSTSLMGCVLLLFIFLAKWLLKNKLQPRWAYLLWMLLVFRLLLPWTPESSFSVFNIFPHEKFQTFSDNRQVGLENETIATTVDSDIEIPASSHMQSIDDGAIRPSESTEALGKPVSLIQIISVIWLIGVLVLFGFILAANVRFANKVKKEPKLSDSNTISLFARCKAEMNVRQTITLFQTSQVSSPTLFGVFKPKLLMPESVLRALSQDQLRYVFLHELAHVKRNDIAMNWVMNILLTLHWFNPLLWFSYHKMREDQEMACDALTLTRIKPEESKAYALTIIALLDSFRSPVRLAGAASMSGNKKELKRRILMITSLTKNSTKWSLLGLAIILLISGCVLTNAKSNQNSKPIIPEESLFNITLDVPNKLRADEPFAVNSSLVNRSQSSWELEHGADMFTYDIYDSSGELIKQGGSRFVDQIGFIKTLKPNEIFSYDGGEYVHPKYNVLTLEAGSYKIAAKAKFRIKYEGKYFDFDIKSEPLEIKVLKQNTQETQNAPNPAGANEVGFNENDAIAMVLKAITKGPQGRDSMDLDFPQHSGQTKKVEAPIGGKVGTTTDLELSTYAEKKGEVFVVTLIKDWNIKVGNKEVVSYLEYQVDAKAGVKLIKREDNDKLLAAIK